MAFVPPTTPPASGELALLFTDIEGSTQLAQALGPQWPATLRLHRELSRAAFQQYDGHEVDTAGDGFFVVFVDRERAVGAAIAAQRALTAASWPTDATVRVRMGLHHGHVESYDGGYVGYEVHRAARITAAAHGGQVLASDAIVRGLQVPREQGLAAVDLGQHRLKDLRAPEQLFQLKAPGIETAFPPVRALAGAELVSAADLPTTTLGGVEVAPAVLGLPDGRRLMLTSSGLRIGRVTRNDLVLADPSVSRHHCAISATKRGFVVTDLQSTHGTHVNDDRLEASRLLVDGDVLRVGDTKISFTWPG
ncbi:hypothetical protein ASD81_06425 [Nocardioides sp. Root614]|nr:hypothetical protein ASD81_06425 [Nocardioides sp. Root614]KRA92236.1 hypothetical protein ASD84_06690 [Nocardioides sp. Root682]